MYEGSLKYTVILSGSIKRNNCYISKTYAKMHTGQVQTNRLKLTYELSGKSSSATVSFRLTLGSTALPAMRLIKAGGD